MKESSNVEVTENDHIAIVTIKRTEKLNALNPALIQELKNILQRLEENENVRAIVLIGSGSSFIVGADINVLKDLGTFTAREFITQLHQLLYTIRYHDKAIIAAVNGHCYGAGLELAISCDLVIASEQAKFAMQEVKIGIPSVIEAALLPFTIGLLKTKELLLTGEVLEANEAKKIGLINHLVNHEKLLKKTMEFASKITENPGYSVSLQKELINRWMENAGVEQSVKNGVDSFGIAYGKEETREHLAGALHKGGR